MPIDIPTDIINLSLGMLNVSPIVDINDPDEIDSARIKKQVSITRIVCLSDHPWGFAKKKLAKATLQIDNGFYILPSDWVQALFPKIISEFVKLNPDTMQYVHLVGFDSQDFMEILYIFEAPYELWDAPFTNYFIKKLAYDVAIYFGKDAGKMQLLERQIQIEKIDISKRFTANYEPHVVY